MWQRKKILRTAGIAFLVLLAGAGAFTLYLDHRVRTEFEGRRFALPARIYARPLELTRIDPSLQLQVAFGGSAARVRVQGPVHGTVAPVAGPVSAGVRRRRGVRVR